MLWRNEEECLAYEAELDELRTKVEGYEELKTKVTLENVGAYGGPLARKEPRVKISEPVLQQSEGRERG